MNRRLQIVNNPNWSHRRCRCFGSSTARLHVLHSSAIADSVTAVSFS